MEKTVDLDWLNCGYPDLYNETVACIPGGTVAAKQLVRK